MDSILKFIPSTLLGFFVFLVILCFLTLWRTPSCKEAPVVPGSWPILGHLHLLGGKELPQKILGAMADTYGPIFTMHIGVHRAVVVNNWEVAKECYTTHDQTFSSRPTMTAGEILGYNYVMFPFSPYGSHWRELRKFSVSEVLSSQRLELLKHVREYETGASIKELYDASAALQNKACSASIEMKQWFADVSLNIILRLIVGKRYNSGDSKSRRCQKASRNFMRLWGLFIVEDAIPGLGWLDLHGYKKEMKNTVNELDILSQGWLDEHKEARILCSETNGKRDFMDAMMSMYKDPGTSKCDVDTIIKTTCLSIVIGGSDTMMITLTWILSLLLNNKGALKKAQDELDKFVGKDRQVNESDIKNLIYLQAIIKEAFRLYPPSPLSGPRVATDDCTLAGYHVKAGTRLLINVWKMHRDPLVWSDRPSKFLPERFLTNHVDVDARGHHYELMPFGGGRRSCPGISFALQVLPLIMAQLLHVFEITTPMDMPVDMTETTGLTSYKAMPLEVVIKPRLSPKMYEQNSYHD